MESILTSIKKLLLISEDYIQFDADIIMHINSVFMTLQQLGVGPSEGFFIEDATAKWTDFVDDITQIQAVKTYIYLKVKLLFDPASVGSSTLASYERQIQELEWRLNWVAECSRTGGVSGGGSVSGSGSGSVSGSDTGCDCADELSIISDKIGDVDKVLDEITKHQTTTIELQNELINKN